MIASDKLLQRYIKKGKPCVGELDNKPYCNRILDRQQVNKPYKLCNLWRFSKFKLKVKGNSLEVCGVMRGHFGSKKVKGFRWSK